MHSVVKELNEIKSKISPQIYRTIMGQIRAGDMRGASVGIERLKQKIAGEAAGNGRKTDTGNRYRNV
uniref:hypothetical protein n=1 Tax=Agathobacter sp. TaxID=2021311 RepID=UPI004056CA44